ncbi:MAG TPA: phosphonate ABC transporter, permease protein PhnE [Stellaceae bacterium]|nr:phosphonate ABC transporter, permease protein PhnE [Stellaceae bacterium]
MSMQLRQALFGDVAAAAERHCPLLRHARIRAWREIGLGVLLLVLLCAGLWRVDFGFARMLAGFEKFGEILVRMLPPTPDTWSRFTLYFDALLETLGLALIGTLTAAVLAFPLGLLAARAVTGSSILHMLLHRLFDMIRGIDRFVWALIFVRVVGLGPFAGALAIAVTNIGAFGKLFSETFDASDRKPVEGVLSTGGGKGMAIRFAMIPQVFPVIASQVLYYFESDTRSATVIGIVGAGGIGLVLYEEIRTLEWQHVACLILMILVTVAAIDALSGFIRRSFIGADRRDPPSD